MNNKQLLLIGGAAVALIVIIAAALLILPGLGGAGNHVILASINNDGEADLNMLPFGDDFRDGIEIAEDAQLFGCEFAIIDDDNITPVPLGIGFIPGSHDSIFCVREDDEIHVLRMGTRDEEPTALLEADGYVTGYIFPDREQIILVEDRGDQQRCYLSSNGEEAERIAKGDTCQPVMDGSAVITADRDSDGLSLSFTDVRRGDEVTLLDEEPAFTDYVSSFDGTRLMLVETDDGNRTIHLMDTSDGEFIAESDEYVRVNIFRFASRENAAYAIAENEDGMLVLLVLDANRFTEIAEGDGLTANADPSGRYLLYQVVDEEGESDVFSYDFSRGETHDIYSGEQIQFATSENIERVLILERDENEYTLYSVPFNGGEALELVNVDDIYYLNVETYSGDDRLFVSYSSEDGLSLFVTSASKANGYLLLDEWNTFEPLRLTSNGRTLAFSGRNDDGDDLTLFSALLEADSDPLELDDDMDDLLTELVMISSNQREIVYTVSTGDASDNLEVRTVRIDGKESPEAVYDEIALIAAGWHDLNSFQTVPFGQIVGAMTTPPVSPEPVAEPEPSSPPQIVGTIQTGETVYGEITSGAGLYYRYNGQAGDVITIMLNGINGLDTVVEFMDADYNLIDVDDDGGEGRNSLLEVEIPRSGQYFIHVRGYGSGTGDYSLTLTAGSVIPTEEPVVQETAEPVESPASTMLAIGSTVHGRVTSSSGDRWPLQLNAGDLVAIAMDGIEGLDTFLEFLDPGGNQIATNDDGGDGFNSLLITRASQSGTYTVVARGFGNNTGEYLLSVEDISGSMRGSLQYNRTTSGSIDGAEEFEIWSFEGHTGDLIAITMDGPGALDPYLSFFNPDFELISSNDDGGAGTDSVIFLNMLPETGTYYVLAKAYSGTGQYDLTVLLYSPENQAPLQIGNTYSRSFTDYIGNIDVLSGSSGQVISIAMNAVDDLDPVIGIFDQEWNLITSDDDSGEGFDALISGFEFPDSDIYYLVQIALDDELGNYNLEIINGVRPPVD
ncbi:MAG: PPC domain-containing protein [Anaerolineales bacterium]|nr:PPC domain-containing protein [Anaerolineales bacterium]